MKKFLFSLTRLSLFIFTFSLSSAAQQPNLDSLWNIWNDQTQPDTTRLKAMSKIAFEGYLYSQPDSAFYFAQMQYDLAEKSGLKKQMSKALATQGISLAIRGDNSKALEYFQKGLKIKEEIGDKYGIANSLNNISFIYKAQSDYPKMLSYLQRSLKMMSEIGDKKGIARSLNNIGGMYFDQGILDKALDYYTRSLKIGIPLRDQGMISSTYLNMGMIYQIQGDLSKSIDYFTQSLKITDQQKNSRKKAHILLAIGGAYMSQGDDVKALDHFNQSLTINKQMGDKGGISRSLFSIGLVYDSQGTDSKALDFYTQSLRIDEQIGYKKGIADALVKIGHIHKNQDDFSKALTYCSESYEVALSIGDLGGQKDGCKCLYETYKVMGKANEALVYMDKMRVVEDSLTAQETNKKLQQMEFAKKVFADSMATVEEARLVEEAHQEEVRAGEKTRNIAIGGGLFLLLAAGGIYSRLRYVRKSRAMLQVEKDRSENLLLNILPADIAEELKTKGKADARDFELVSILFTDFKSFTATSEKMSAKELVGTINHCFEAFDAICEKYKVEKIKTIGDAYMAAGGLPVPSEDSIKNTVLAALEMQEFITRLHKEKEAKGEHAFEMRVGVHTGPVVAGIVGVKKFQYDIWGDTVNTASRMESSGDVGRVNVSQATYELLKDDPSFTFESRGKIKTKGKGEMDMYFVSLAEKG